MGRHPGDREVDQVVAVDQLAHRPADHPGRRPAGREVVAQEEPEVVVARVVDDAIGIVEALDAAQLWSVRPAHDPVATHPSLGRQIDEVLAVVQQRHRVDVGAEAEHAAAAADEPFERGARAVVVVPGHVGHELGGEATRRAHATLRMVAHERSGAGAEHLGEHADVGIGR